MASLIDMVPLCRLHVRRIQNAFPQSLQGMVSPPIMGGSNTKGPPTHAKVVGSHGQSESWSSILDPGSGGHSHNRCLQTRVGRSFSLHSYGALIFAPLNGRLLVPGPSSVPYKSVSSVPSSQVLRPSSTRVINHSPMRKYDSSHFPEQGGRDQESNAVQGYNQVTPLVPQARNITSRRTSPGGGQHNIRCPPQLQTGFSVRRCPSAEGGLRGVASQSSDLSVAVQLDHSPSRGSICLQLGPSAPYLLQRGDRSNGSSSGHHGSGLVEQRNFRVPSSGHDPARAREVSTIKKVPSASTRTAVTQTGVVSTPSGSSTAPLALPECRDLLSIGTF